MDAMVLKPILEYRRLSPTDQTGLANLFAEIVSRGDDRYFHPHPFTPEEAAARCAYQGQDLFYIAVDDQAVYAYGMLRGWEEGYDIPSLGIAVAASARRTGVAASFMHFLHAAAARRGAPSVRLKVYPENVPARRLYERLGYRFEPDTSGEQFVGHFSLEKKGS